MIIPKFLTEEWNEVGVFFTIRLGDSEMDLIREELFNHYFFGLISLKSVPSPYSVDIFPLVLWWHKRNCWDQTRDKFCGCQLIDDVWNIGQQATSMMTMLRDKKEEPRAHQTKFNWKSFIGKNNLLRTTMRKVRNHWRAPNDKIQYEIWKGGYRGQQNQRLWKSVGE